MAYPETVFDGSWTDYQTPLNATNLNMRDAELRAIELALGTDIVPSGSYMLSNYIWVTGATPQLTIRQGAICNGVFQVPLANDITIGMYGASPYYGVRMDMDNQISTGWTREFSWSRGGSKMASIGLNADNQTPNYVYINANQGGATTGYDSPHLVVRANGMVGIGTKDPTGYHLKVSGVGSGGTMFRIHRNADLQTSQLASYMDFSFNSGSSELNRVRFVAGGRNNSGGNNGGFLDLQTTPDSGGNPQSRLFMDEYGFVGIGTVSPWTSGTSPKLAVAGHVKLGVDGDSTLGFYGANPQTRRNVSTSGTTDEQLTSLRNALQTIGLIALV